MSMLNSIIRRNSIHPEHNSSLQESPKAVGTKEYYDRSFGKLAAARETPTSADPDAQVGNSNLLNLPTVLDSCNCTYILDREEDSISSSTIDGRLYLTSKALYFVSLLGNNSFVLDWLDATECFTTVPDAITIHYHSLGEITKSHIFSKLHKRDRVFRLINQLILDRATTGTRKSLNQDLNNLEPRGRIQTEVCQILEKTSNKHSNSSQEPQKVVSTPSFSHHDTVISSPKSTSRSRTKSEPEVLDHVHLLKADRVSEDGSIALNLSDSIETSDTPPHVQRVDLRRERSKTLPDLTFSTTGRGLDPPFDLQLLSEIKPLKKINRQESMTSTMSQRRRVVKYKGKKKAKREEAEKQSGNSLGQINPHRVSGSHRNTFLHHFGQDGVQSNIILTYSCAYHPKNDDAVLPLLHGRMFCTYDNLYFVGWQNKKIVLPWDDVISLQRESTAWRTIPNAIRIFYNSHGVSSSYFFGSFINRDSSIIAIQNLLNFRRSEKKTSGSRNNLSRKRSIGYLPETLGTNPRSGKTIVVPPDERISSMTKMAHKRLRNVSVQEFFNKCWLDESASFYARFLSEKCQNHDILVGKWEVNNSIDTNGGGFYHAWSEDRYNMKRVRLRIENNFNLLISIFILRLQ